MTDKFCSIVIIVHFQFCPVGSNMSKLSMRMWLIWRLVNYRNIICFFKYNSNQILCADLKRTENCR